MKPARSSRIDWRCSWLNFIDFAGQSVKFRAMDADERDICLYLKGFPGQFISGREISRRAGGKWRYREEPTWATPVLGRLVERAIIESDATGHYRLVLPRKKDKKSKRWVSPQMKEILERSGKKFDEPIELEDPEDFFDR